jgi:hypothetical protein
MHGKTTLKNLLDNKVCLLQELQERYKCAVWTKFSVFKVKAAGTCNSGAVLVHVQHIKSN